MDTVMTLSASGSGAKAALKEAEEEIYALEALFSRTRPGSDVCAVNGRTGASAGVSADTEALLKAAEEYRAATGGAFDVTVAPVMDAWGFAGGEYRVPSDSEIADLLPLVDGGAVRTENGTVTLEDGQSVDFGGIAKGFASDRLEELFHRHGISSGMISLGGNVYVHGTKPDGSLWKVGVRDPEDPGSLLGVLQLRDAYAITSGGYQRYFEEDGVLYHHIIDPADGRPARSGLSSVTVTAPANGSGGSAPGNGTMCDALSTALFVMGEERALAFWRESGLRFDMILVTEDGRILVTEGIADSFRDGGSGRYAFETVS